MERVKFIYTYFSLNGVYSIWPDLDSNLKALFEESESSKNDNHIPRMVSVYHDSLNHHDILSMKNIARVKITKKVVDQMSWSFLMMKIQLWCKNRMQQWMVDGYIPLG